MHTVAVIDGMGGGIGAQIVEHLRKEEIADISIIALGTNGVATQRMIAAGAQRGASGENAIGVSVASADIIIGPIGIVLPNAMMGEITPAIAGSVFNAPGKKLLLPLSQPHLTIVGAGSGNINDLINQTVSLLRRLIAGSD